MKAQETQTLSVVTELWTYRGLVYNLAERDLRSRYRRSVLGWAADNNALLIPAHLGGHHAAEVVRDGNKFAIRGWAAFRPSSA